MRCFDGEQRMEKPVPQISAPILLFALILSISVGHLFSNIEAGEPCEEWVAKVVSVQGSVHGKRAGAMEWLPVKMNDTFCLGDMIRTEELSRAGIVLPNEVVLRLDQKTTITFNGITKQKTSLINLIKGAIHSFSRLRAA